MPRPTVDQIRSMSDFATTFRWNLQVVKFPEAMTSESPGGFGSIRQNVSDILSAFGVRGFPVTGRLNQVFGEFTPTAPSAYELNLRCESADIPRLEGSHLETNIRGFVTRQPGVAKTSATINLQFVETSDNYVSRFVKTWRDLVWDQKSTKSYNKSLLESVILLQRLNSLDQVIFEYKLIGCVLESYDPGHLESANSDALRISMTLSYDYFEDREISATALDIVERAGVQIPVGVKSLASRFLKGKIPGV